MNKLENRFYKKLNNWGYPSDTQITPCNHQTTLSDYEDIIAYFLQNRKKERKNMEFKDTVKQIKNSAKNVDKVLKAAKLQRHERSVLSEETIFAMFTLLLCFGFVMALFVFG